jgi:hypothetical protein
MLLLVRKPFGFCNKVSAENCRKHIVAQRIKRNKKSDSLRSFKMWNLFERIINAIKPCEQSQQPSEESHQPCDQSQQPCDQSESWNEDSPEQVESPQETADVTQQNEWQKT